MLAAFAEHEELCVSMAKMLMLFMLYQCLRYIGRMAEWGVCGSLSWNTSLAEQHKEHFCNSDLQNATRVHMYTACVIHAGQKKKKNSMKDLCN